MTTFTAAPAATSVRHSGRVRAARIGRWAVRVLLAAQFVAGGVFKLTGDPTMVAMFDDIGAGQGCGCWSGPASWRAGSACCCPGSPGWPPRGWSA